MATSQSEAVPVNTQGSQTEVTGINERFAIWTWCPEDDGPPSHYVIKIWQRQGGPRIHDHAAGPFATKDEAKAALDRILALKAKAAAPHQFQLVMSRSLDGYKRLSLFLVTRTWSDGVTSYQDLEAGPFLTFEEAEVVFDRLKAQQGDSNPALPGPPSAMSS